MSHPSTEVTERDPPRVVVSRALLGVAWPLFVVSLATPALDGNAAFSILLLPFERAPAAFLVVGAILALRPVTPPSPYLLLVPGLAAIALAPWLAMPSSHRQILRRVLSFGLLSPWWFWMVCQFVLTPYQRNQWIVARFYWGFYVFAAAHTLAFLSVWSCPWALRADRRRGFGLVTEQPNEPARSPDTLTPHWSPLVDDPAELPASPPLMRASDPPLRPWPQRLLIVLIAAAVSALAALFLWAFAMH